VCELKIPPEPPVEKRKFGTFGKKLLKILLKATSGHGPISAPTGRSGGNKQMDNEAHVYAREASVQMIQTNVVVCAQSGAKRRASLSE
jgi:hypothetical protein